MKRNLIIGLLSFFIIISMVQGIKALDQNCFQEFADVSTACGGLNTGNYTLASSSGGTPKNMYDGNWSSYTANYQELYINYTKPLGSSNLSVWTLHYRSTSPYADTTENRTIPQDCFGSDNDTFLQLGVILVSAGLDYLNLQCWNYTSNAWKLLKSSGVSGDWWFYEEAMIWENSTNLTIPIGSGDFPQINITEPNMTYNISSIFINVSAEDLDGIDTGYYNITTSLGALVVANRFVFNSTNKTDRVTLLNNDYIIYVWFNDTFDNSNYTSASFSVNVSSAPPPPAGGGSSIISYTPGPVINNAANWTMKTASGALAFQRLLIQGGTKKDTLYFENTGEVIRNIRISCEGSLCDTVLFSETSFELPVGKGIVKENTVSVTIPDDYQDGKYYFNIVAKDEENGQRTITYEADVGQSGLLSAITYKLTSSASLLGIPNIPYWLILLVSIILSGFVSFVIFSKKSWAVPVSLVLGIITGIIIVAII